MRIITPRNIHARVDLEERRGLECYTQILDWHTVEFSKGEPTSQKWRLGDLHGPVFGPWYMGSPCNRDRTISTATWSENTENVLPTVRYNIISSLSIFFSPLTQFPIESSGSSLVCGTYLPDGHILLPLFPSSSLHTQIVFFTKAARLAAHPSGLVIIGVAAPFNPRVYATSLPLV